MEKGASWKRAARPQVAAPPPITVSSMLFVVPAGAAGMALVQIAELGVLAVEEQADSADRSVTLLRDDHFAGIVNFAQPLLPPLIAIVELVVRLVRSAARLGAFKVILFAEHEHHHVGVLLDRARFAKV